MRHELALSTHAGDDPLRNEVEHLKEIVKNKNREIELLNKEVGNVRQEKEKIKEHANYCLIIVLNNKLAKQRFEVMKKLKGFGIGTSIYYPGPIPNFKYYRQKYNLKKNHYPNALEISMNSIALPVGPHLDSEDMLYISNCLKNIIFKEK